jgi:hypothetical protein
VRISGTPAINTKQAAEAAERAHIERLWSPPASEKKEIVAPRFEEFVEQFLAVAATQNKPSTQQDKASILTHHLTPAFGRTSTPTGGDTRSGGVKWPVVDRFGGAQIGGVAIRRASGEPGPAG